MPASKTAWVVSPVTGVLVAPKVAWLLDRLAAINPPAAAECPDVIDHHAHQIYGNWLAHIARGDNHGFQITGKERPRAKRIAADRGIAYDLGRLLKVAKGKSDPRWWNAWLGVSATTRSAIKWKPGRQPGLRGPGFEVRVRGLHALVPTRADAIPLIEAALDSHLASPIAERSARKVDHLADDFARSVAVAYSDLTGERGITWSVRHQEYRSGLETLRRDINRQFQTDDLLTVARLRKNISER